MSRTDKQTPWWVKTLQPEWRRHVTEVHNHRTGPCDLPAHRAAGRVWARTCCYLEPRWVGRNIWCPCGGCTGSWYRAAIHRRARTAWRGFARTAVKTRPVDRGELDSPGYRRRSSW